MITKETTYIYIYIRLMFVCEKFVISSIYRTDHENATYKTGACTTIMGIFLAIMIMMYLCYFHLTVCIRIRSVNSNL